MTDEMIPVVAERFRALSEPARLFLLRALLSGGEQTVNELVEETGLQQANVSKHLQVLHGHGFLKRRKNGLFVYYSLADRQVAKLCDLMCRRVVVAPTLMPADESATG
jgi:DNA-binding transcriptional ArsR family regulator